MGEVPLYSTECIEILLVVVDKFDFMRVQGYLAHKKYPPP